MKTFRACLLALMAVAAGASSFGAAPVHRLVTAWRFADQTDGHNELVHKSEWLLMDNDNPVDVRANALDVADLLSGTGVVYVVEGPATISRWEDKPDFTFSGTDLVVHSNGFSVASLPYSGGAFGRLRALRAHSRRHYPYDPRRDGLMMSNTWGDRNGFARINAQDMLRELDAAASLGVDVMQIDAGWAQVNETPREQVTGPLEWERYWNPPEGAWEVNGKRFPKGLKEISLAAKEKGIALGLWFAPDCANDAAAWRRDADTLLNLWRRDGVRFFKTDFMSVYSKRGFDNERAFFDAVLDESKGEVAFDLDVTGNVPRLGCFGAPRCGVFVENRYARPGERRPYYPHRTLRNLWALAETVDPIRLRMEFMNPLRNAETYGDSPLAPSKWPADALLATVLASSPLAWMDCVDVKEETLAAWRPLVAAWKRVREDWHSGTLVPIGARPDGVSWTGFASVSENGRGGFALVFRELSGDKDHVFDLRPYFGALTAVPETLAGRGAAALERGRLSVNVPAELDFVWVRF